MRYQIIKRCMVAFWVFVGLVTGVTKLSSFKSVDILPETPRLSYLTPIEVVSVSQDASYEPIIGRPLFWAGRTPYVPPQEPKEEPVQEKPNNALEKAQVLGLWAAGDASSVVIKVDGSVSRLALNEVFSGWRLVEVTSDRAKFVLEQTSKEQENVKEIQFKQRAPLPSDWLGDNGRFSEIE
ncbi:hypothetical protein [Gilvimarinus xylanilyticus]|uniref:Type II secretion system protein GspC N-terminal domain-containing protein n=1 Tax=Gilvimarinus xylanilyticus TaxID=2944139 RepID=A0A9X2HXA6_9GAMM|nr:hypothetical protein [Gilvimarinus xylanilyticus]MCP8899359.1 hypothetical protein [Gilvimarinus xylanilyticus]